MEARYKLKETRHFLDNLKTLNKGSDEFIFNLSAFLTAWRSVIAVLLYDYMEKYFGFTREEHFGPRDFEIAARVSGNPDAISFVTWWRKQINILKQNALWMKRNINVHRGRPPVKIRLYLRESMALTSVLDVHLAPGAAITIETPTTVVPALVSRTTRMVYFEDFPAKDIIDVCEEGFQQIKDMVDEAEMKFGNS